MQGKNSNQIVIRIADIGCRVKSYDADFMRLLSQRYSSFLSSGEVSFEVDMEVKSSTDNIPLLSDDPVVEVVSSNNSWVVRRLDKPFEANVDLKSRRIDLSVTGSECCFDSFLRILYSMLLVQAGGMFFHAASIKNSSGACILLGASGSGKTTLARLATDTVLSDELVAVRRANGTFYAFSTPFWGEFAAGNTNEKAELKAVYLLKKDTENFVKPIKRQEAILETLSCTLFFGPEELTKSVFDLCFDLLTTIPVEELYFRPSSAVFDLINRGVALHEK